MIEIKNKAECSGCTACKNICPKNAIKMEEDVEGFKYPSINKEKCIECNLCEKVCPILNIKTIKNGFALLWILIILRLIRTRME